MAKLKPAQIAEVKGKGFLINRGTENFSGRIVPRGTVFSPDDLKTVSEISSKFGNGKVIPTTRLGLEIQGIPYENVQDAIDYAESHGLKFGGTGNKIRPITSCKGTTCVYGNYDTHALAAKLYDEYYIGWADIKLPHKFKMVIDENVCKTCGVCSESKCPFKAVKPHNEVVYQIYVGGTWGKKSRMGTPLSKFVSEEEIAPILEKTMIWFKLNANQKERLGVAIDRLGVEKFEKDVLENDELLEKKDILFE